MFLFHLWKAYIGGSRKGGGYYWWNNTLFYNYTSRGKWKSAGNFYTPSLLVRLFTLLIARIHYRSKFTYTAPVKLRRMKKHAVYQQIE